MKIYVHHYFSKKLFYKLAHNTTDRVYDINDDIGSVFCKYKNVSIEFIFSPILNDNSDGYHLVDFFTALRNKDNYLEYKDIDISDSVEDVPFIKRFYEMLSDKKDWIITFFRTEKLITKYDVVDAESILEVEENLLKLSNHRIISDNIFLKDGIRSVYKNIYYTFTNSIYQWNEIIGIRWYYEYGNMFKLLSPPYSISYSVRNHKTHRVDILKGLSSMNDNRILLVRTDTLKNHLYVKHNETLLKYPNIKLSLSNGDVDFDDISYIENICIGNDLFFRILSQSKMQILDESWAWSDNEFTSQYLSEKTIGLILAGIPFISTHSYPLSCLQKVLDIPPHPFYEDFKYHKGDSTKFVLFIDKFMKNFEDNYTKCKQWSDICKEKFMKKLNTENNLLDILSDNFNSEDILFNKSMI
jgi:hypothetical protein